MSVTLSEVKRAARAHRAPLAGESAGYLVLAIADQVLQAPRLVQADEIQLTEDGALRVLAGRASSDEEAELSLRSALDQLLLVASSGSAALSRAGRRTSPVGLAALVRELEAALIPVNRSAARRALSRLHRETARALDSGHLPEEDPPKAIDGSPSVAQPLAPVLAAAPPIQTAVAAPQQTELPASEAEPEPEPEREPELELELETPVRAIAVLSSPLPARAQTQLDGVISALCDELPPPPQLVESDPLTSALAVRSASVPVVAAVPVVAPASIMGEAEPEFLLDIDIELATDAVDSSAAPTVMRAVEVQPAPLFAPAAGERGDASCEPPPTETMFEAPLEARTVPEPVMLRKTLRRLLDVSPQPISAECEPLAQTPPLGALDTQLPILAPEQLTQLSCPAPEPLREEPTELMPEVEPLAPGVAMVESKKSDVNELLSSFHVGEAEADSSGGLSRAIKEMAELDLTPGPFAALIR